MTFSYLRQAEDYEIRREVTRYVNKGQGGTTFLTAKKVRLCLERMGFEADSRHISAILGRQAKDEGWKRLAIIMHKGNKVRYAYIARKEEMKR
jgi:hypothetical protein